MWLKKGKHRTASNVSVLEDHVEKGVSVSWLDKHRQQRSNICKCFRELAFKIMKFQVQKGEEFEQQ